MSKVKIINFRYKIISFILVGLLFSCKARKSDLSVGEKDLLISSADIFLSDWHLHAANADYENGLGMRLIPIASLILMRGKLGVFLLLKDIFTQITMVHWCGLMSF